LVVDGGDLFGLIRIRSSHLAPELASSDRCRCRICMVRTKGDRGTKGPRTILAVHRLWRKAQLTSLDEILALT
jgi:hypothetical protein